MQHQIRDLAFKLLLLFVLLFTVDYSVGVIYNRISDIALEKAPNASRTAFTMKKVSAEVLIMGSSRANRHYVPSIISDSLNKTVFNCGLDGQPFAYSVAMIHAVLKRYTPQAIIVDIDPRMLDNKYSLGGLAQLYPYYGDDEFYKEILIKEDANNRYKMMSRMYRYNSKLIGLVGKMIVSDYVQEDGYGPLPVSGYKYRKLKIVEYDVDKPVTSSQVELMLNCIKTCKEKNVDLIISVSPRFQKSNISQVNSFKSLKELLKVNNTSFIYMGDNSIINDSVMYWDDDHLNRNGAEAFTTLFVEKLQEHFKENGAHH